MEGWEVMRVGGCGTGGWEVGGWECEGGWEGGRRWGVGGWCGSSSGGTPSPCEPEERATVDSIDLSVDPIRCYP